MQKLSLNVLITGTSLGIGKAIAEYFLEKNCNVHGIDRLPSTIIDVRYHHHICDVRYPELFPILPEMDIVINNAGTQNEDDININLKGTINITEKYAIQPRIKSVLNIGSASAHTGAEFPEYSASKGGILAYTKNVGLRIAKYGATCNSLDPGGVITDLNKCILDDYNLWNQVMELTPLKKWSDTREMAEWAYFLTVINKSATCQNFLVDNGEAANSTFIWKEEQ